MRMQATASRALLIIGLALACVGVTAAPADATTGPQRLQRLAAVQTQALFRFYNGQPQTASPPTCKRAKHLYGRPGLLVLPTLSFGSGNATFSCRTRAHAVLVDLGGFIVTEDARGDTYTLADDEVLTFTRANLPRICDDALRFIPPAPATLDGHPVVGTAVATGNFRVQVNPGADNTPGSPLYQDSIDVGHPGVLTACYTGYKALIPVTPGRHILSVDLSALTVGPTEFTYVLDVAGT
jgi:hypothetical protein